MRLLLVREVAEVLRVPRSRAYELVREGLIPSIRLGRQVRIPEAALRKWIDAGGRSLPGGWRHSSSDRDDHLSVEDQ